MVILGIVMFATLLTETSDAALVKPPLEKKSSKTASFVLEKSRSGRLMGTWNSEHAIQNIPLLADCSDANWRLIAVSGAHVVFRYGGSVPELQSRVLKLRKQQSDVGWALRRGFAQVLRELRNDAAISCRSGGHNCIYEEQTASKLYSLISRKYLPLQEITRVPQTVAERLLVRAANEGTHATTRFGPPHTVQPRQSRPECASHTSSGTPQLKAESWQPPEGASPPRDDSGPKQHRGRPSGENERYTLCLLEEDLVTAPELHSALHAEGARRSVPTHHRTSGGRTLSTVHVSKQAPNPPLPTMYYAVELKPKCGLLEPLDGQPLALPAGVRQGRPAHVTSRQVFSPTRLISYTCRDITSEGQLPERHATAALRRWPPPASTPGPFNLRRSLRGRRRSLGDIITAEAASANAGIEHVKLPVRYCLGNRFRMQQYSKLKTGRISRPSAYDPIQFFRCTRRAIRRQLLNLVDNPQNNMKVFINGACISNFGEASTVKSAAESSYTAEAAERSRGTHAHKFAVLLLEQIWEREKELFGVILTLQAFAAGQQHLSVQLVRELRGLLGTTYEKLREEQFLRDVNLYLEAASAGTAFLRSTTDCFESRRNVCTLSGSSNCVAGVSPPSPQKNPMKADPQLKSSPYQGRRVRGSYSTLTTQSSLHFLDALRVQCEHEREGVDILNALKAAEFKDGNRTGVESTEVSRTVNAAFRWLRQYLLGRTFMDISVFTNVLITNGGTPLAMEAQGMDDPATGTGNRFEQLELDAVLAADIALLVGNSSRSTVSGSEEATLPGGSEKDSSPHLSPTVFFRVTVTDMDFKSDKHIEEWSKKWTDVQRVYFQVRP